MTKRGGGCILKKQIGGAGVNRRPQAQYRKEFIMGFIKDNFLLKNKTAEKLYNDYAKSMPIFDYHCHLSEKQLLENKRFDNIFDIWLAGDHYKWRLMRNFGIPEELITGNADKKDKFRAYLRALESAFGNPLYHWSAVELKEYFNCEVELREENADVIWDWCNDFIALNDITPASLIENSLVTNVFTTNEMFDDLSTFEKLSEKFKKFKVTPAFRADKIMNIDAEKYPEFVKLLEACSHKITDLGSLEKAVELRLKEFIKVGAKATDISFEKVLPVGDREKANEAFIKAVGGGKLTLYEAEEFKGYFAYFLMKLYAKYNLKTELHVGALRNVNKKAFDKLGLDTGYDIISDSESLTALARLFDRLNNEDGLPACILFNLNPKMNAEFMSLIGAFQGNPRGVMQYGPAWWFLDNKAGMEKHLIDLTATGHLGVFVGMLTDSRSFLSYPRHHYFRRILCSYLGELIERGEMTDDLAFVGKVVQNICYNNAINYFGMNK